MDLVDGDRGRRSDLGPMHDGRPLTTTDPMDVLMQQLPFRHGRQTRRPLPCPHPHRLHSNTVEHLGILIGRPISHLSQVRHDHGSGWARRSKVCGAWEPAVAAALEGTPRPSGTASGTSVGHSTSRATMTRQLWLGHHMSNLEARDGRDAEVEHIYACRLRLTHTRDLTGVHMSTRTPHAYARLLPVH